MEQQIFFTTDDTPEVVLQKMSIKNNKIYSISELDVAKIALNILDQQKDLSENNNYMASQEYNEIRNKIIRFFVHINHKDYFFNNLIDVTNDEIISIKCHQDND